MDSYNHVMEEFGTRFFQHFCGISLQESAEQTIIESSVRLDLENQRVLVSEAGRDDQISSTQLVLKQGGFGFKYVAYSGVVPGKRASPDGGEGIHLDLSIDAAKILENNWLIDNCWYQLYLDNLLGFVSGRNLAGSLRLLI